ncbi:hypothetical protein SEPCBS119000_003595 [Sporothrix epigloea]|uniref:DNA replication regulator SLD2 n=1 Tax=Sporothrix epigloea TaxID=1892477 RepID=A0ABP0DMH9_9PEZI
MLDPAERVAVEAETQQLRLALKTWETTWAREHSGVKPTRDDISRHPEIANKYKAYNHARALLSGQTSTKSDTKRDGPRRKRKSETCPPVTVAPADSQPTHSRSKRARATELSTPSRTATLTTAIQGDGAVLDVSLDRTPSISRKLFSPVIPTSVGPTPQRDGRVLGLFDVLDEEEKKAQKRSAIAATPSKRMTAEADTALRQSRQRPGQTPASVLGGTPRKQTLDIATYNSDDEDGENFVNARRLGRTPMSSSQRNLLNHFTAGGRGTGPFSIDGNTSTTTRDSNGALGTTPLKARSNDNQKTHEQRLLATPSKGSTEHFQGAFATPAFLRRQLSTLAPVDENGEFLSPPGKLRLPRKPLMRGLSSVLASLRKAEDDKLDEQLDVLRELENDVDKNPRSRPQTQPSSQRPLEKVARSAPMGANAQVSNDPVQGQEEQVQDWEQQELEHHELDLYEKEQAKLESQSQILKPDRVVGGLLGGFDDEGLYDSPPEDQVGRDGQPLRVYKKKGQKRTTRLSHMRPTRTKRPPPGSMAELESDNDTQDEGRDQGENGPAASGPDFSLGVEMVAANERTASKSSENGKESNVGVAAGPVKKAVRKVNELAHANFKRLKLRNHGAKGGPGFKSRFRRKR